MENEEAITPLKAAAAPIGDEIKNFYKKDVLSIIKKVFFQPLDGTYLLFTNKSESIFRQSLILLFSSALISMIFFLLIIPSEMREYFPWFSLMMRAAAFTLVFLFLVSVFSFGIKLLSGKPDFKSELMTGALVGIPFSATVILLFLFSKLMLNENAISNVMLGGYMELISKSGIFLLFILYTQLLSFNILLQSLRSSGTKDTLAWYLSPVGIFLAYYITIKIVI
ncbi:MAG: hypothetical protein J5I50_07940 [Chitinophagaceae bacterium]|nr:hypothetical protein [Chitinophagaceae bacterium]